MAGMTRDCVCLICKDGKVRGYSGTYHHIKDTHGADVKLGVTHQYVDSIGKPPKLSTQKVATNRHISMITVQIPIAVITTGQATVKIEALKEEANE
jgi:hypothetical protein